MPIQPAAEIARRTPDEQPQALPAPRGDGPKRSSTPLAGSRDRVQQRTICPLLKPSPANVSGIIRHAKGRNNLLRRDRLAWAARPFSGLAVAAAGQGHPVE